MAEELPLIPAGQADDGNTEMIIRADRGSVIVRFREPRLWLKLDPPNAARIGKHLIDCAVDCGLNIQLEVPKRTISREQRNMLVARTVRIQASMERKQGNPNHIATAIVDSILAAVE